MSHVTHINESCYTHEWVMSHTWMSHVTHMNESRHTYKIRACCVCIWMTWHTMYVIHQAPPFRKQRRQPVAACCSVLQCVAVCCSVLQWATCNKEATTSNSHPSQSSFNSLIRSISVAVCCSMLQCVAVCCRVLQYVAVCCSMLQCITLQFRQSNPLYPCCNMLQCVAVCCSVLQCVAVCCGMLQCNKVFYSEL